MTRPMGMGSIMQGLRHLEKARLVAKGRAVAWIRWAVLSRNRVILHFGRAMPAQSLFVRMVIIRLRMIMQKAV